MLQMQMFDIACNMNKCKYMLLKQTTDNFNARYTSIFISIQTIIDTWIEMCNAKKIDIVYSELSAAEMASKLLEVAAHYKRYYGNTENSDKIFVFFYYSMSNPEYIYKGIPYPYSPTPRYPEPWIKVFEDMASMIQTICDHIPNMYIVNTTNLPPAILPYSISNDISNACMITAGLNQRILIVSDNVLDYHALATASMLSISNQSRGYVFRRKHEVLFDARSIYCEYIFKQRVQKPHQDVLFGVTYSAVLAAYYGDEFGMDKGNIKLLKSIVNDYIFDTSGSDRIQKYIDFTNQIAECMSFASKIFAIVDIPGIYLEYASVISRNKLLWKKDKIDYGIETINDHWFKHFKVDFGSLMLGV